MSANQNQTAAITPATTYDAEPISYAELRDHLRIDSKDHDEEIIRLLSQARQYCEHWSQRTFRIRVPRTYWYDTWQPFYLIENPPLVEITSVQYRDTAGDLQTLDSANYRAIISTRGQCYVQILADAPADLGDSGELTQDLIILDVITGYQKRSDFPTDAAAAIKLVGEALWDTENDRHTDTVMMRAQQMLDGLQWGYYG